MTREYLIAKVWKANVRHEIPYLESGYAIHNTPENDVQITNLLDATKGREIEWTTLTGPFMSDQEIINRALILKEVRKYSATSYNCEDFARELLGLVRSSPTRNRIFVGGLIAAAVVGAITLSK